MTFLLFGLAAPAFAQCNPPTDAGCVESDGMGPDISIGPNGGHYATADLVTPQTVTVTIRFTDADGINRDSLRLSLTDGANNSVSAFAWNAQSGGTYAFGQCTIQLAQAGDNVLTVTIADRGGKVSTARATFTVTLTDPSLPIVTATPHHNDFRNTSIGASGLVYMLPSYTSLGNERTIGLYYDSEQADPTGFVQLDVEIDYRVRFHEYDGGAITLQILQEVTENGVTVEQAITSQDAWVMNPTGMKQRVGAQWSLRGVPTGAYRYIAEVRAYRADQQTYKAVKIPVRVLVVNESGSRYGAGWSLAGIQRMYIKSAGIVVTEGDGVARYFEKTGCSTTCTWRTPEGDFSTVTYDHPALQYIRTYPDGTRVTFSTQGVMTSIADRFGNTARFDWQESADAQKVPLLTRVTDQAGKVTSLTYHSSMYLKDVTDPAGRVAYFGFSAPGDLISVVGPLNMQATYDATHRVTSHTAGWGKWDITYDARGMQRSITAPAVMTASGQMRPSETHISIPMVTTLASWATHIQYNWAAAVPADAVFESVTDGGGHTTRTMRDRYGNPLTVIDAAGQTSTARYTQHGQPSLISDALQTTSFSWNSRGQLLSKSVNDTVVYHASYATGDQPEYQNFGGTSSIWYSYGPRGELVRSWYGDRSDSESNGTVYQYDPAYRLWKTTGPTGEWREWSYDPVWQNVSEDTTHRPDGTVLQTLITYDHAGRPYTVTSPVGDVTTTTYDVFNRVCRVVDPGQRATEFVYSGLNLASIKDAAGKVYSFTHNALGWIEQENFPDGKFRRSVYDVDGQLVARTDRRGATVERAYDAGHRLIARTADGTQTTFSYPNSHTVVMKNAEVEETIDIHTQLAAPYRATLAFGGGTTYILEDTLDESRGFLPLGVAVTRRRPGVADQTETIGYTENFQPADATLGRILQVRDLSGRTTTLEFDRHNRRVRTLYPSGVAQLFSYTHDQLLTSTRFSHGTVNNKLGMDYGYDTLGRMNSRARVGEDLRRAYGYDGTGQLVRVQTTRTTTEPGCDPSVSVCETFQMPVSAETYTYDAAGNRTDRGAALEPNSNRYRTFNGFTFEYDAEGNVIRKYKSAFNQALAWDALGRLASVTTNGSTVSYGYAPSGTRTRRTEGGSSQYYVYHDDDLLMELDGSFNPTRSYTHLPGIDQPLSVRETNGTANYVYDYVMERPGHVGALLDRNGGVASQYDYAAFGSETADSDGRSLRFMARELDPASGLYYVRNRWYDPATARFVSEDPLGLTAGINTYAYGGNDPINHLDPTGLQWLDPELPPGWVSCTDYSQSWEAGQAITACIRFDYMEWLKAIDARQPRFAQLEPCVEPGAVRIRATIQARNVHMDAFYRNIQRQKCAYWRRQAMGWTLFEALGGTAGAVRQGSTPSYQVRAGVSTSNGRYFNRSHVYVNLGATPRLDGRWGDTEGTSFAAAMRSMARDLGCTNEQLGLRP